MVLKSQTAFALALMCMTSLSSLQAGHGDQDQGSATTVAQREKKTFQIDEVVCGQSLISGVYKPLKIA